MPKAPTTRTSASIADEIANVLFNHPGPARQWKALEILRAQAAAHRDEYLKAFAACGPSIDNMTAVDVFGILHAATMSEFPKLHTAISILSESPEVQAIAAVLQPLHAELEAARAAEDAALQAAADAVTAAQAALEAELAAAQAEIESRASLRQKKSRLAEMRDALVALTGR